MGKTKRKKSNQTNIKDSLRFYSGRKKGGLAIKAKNTGFYTKDAKD